jgi:predicted peptidase
MYVTGISMGGFGTWDIISRHPKMFAAAAPVCGGADLAQAKNIGKLPVWAFHGGKDKIVMPSRSSKMIAALNALGNKSAKYTEYPNVGHNAWDFAYKTPALYDWLLSKKKKK